MGEAPIQPFTEVGENGGDFGEKRPKSGSSGSGTLKKSSSEELRSVRSRRHFRPTDQIIDCRRCARKRSSGINLEQWHQTHDVTALPHLAIEAC
jgi:hypothetical protein